ncbi:MAG: hypothetical protein IIW56_05205, partial [Oscillospiraceae bacterium]|nr:hypothetical protein [Oscillospiraceae bacterium]
QSAIFNRVATALSQCYPECFALAGAWGGSFNKQKTINLLKGKLMVFRICGYKDIACQYVFVYTQALLASTKTTLIIP